MNLKERIETSNKEGDIIENLAINKVLSPVSINPLGKEIGFFKKVNNHLQLHIRTIDCNKNTIWTWFWILDATEEEIAHNKRLNIIKTEVKE